MASVDGYTATRIDQLMGEQIISLRVDASGNLIFKTRAGNETNIGTIVPAKATLEKVYPVGSIYYSSSPTNPGVSIGIGTWERYAKGRVLVSLDEAQTEFDQVGETGGEKTVSLTESQMPNHTHATPAHSHTITASYNVSPVAANSAGFDRMTTWTFGTAASTTRSVTVSTPPDVTGSRGSGTPHQNLQPYQVVYVWRRTA